MSRIDNTLPLYVASSIIIYPSSRYTSVALYDCMFQRKAFQRMRRFRLILEMVLIHFYAKHFEQSGSVRAIKIPACLLGLCLERVSVALNCFTASRKGGWLCRCKDCALFAYLVEILTTVVAIARRLS